MPSTDFILNLFVALIIATTTVLIIYPNAYGHLAAKSYKLVRKFHRIIRGEGEMNELLFLVHLLFVINYIIFKYRWEIWSSKKGGSHKTKRGGKGSSCAETKKETE